MPVTISPGAGHQLLLSEAAAGSPDKYYSLTLGWDNRETFRGLCHVRLSYRKRKVGGRAVRFVGGRRTNNLAYQALSGPGYKKLVAKLIDIVLQARAVWIRLASAFKDEWTIDDYPIRTSFQPASEAQRSSRLKPIPWTASIINWPAISVYGNTRLEALEEVRKNFNQFKATKRSLPRPGTKVPIGFAASDRAGQRPKLLRMTD
jgi:hypothetical protein